VVDHIVEHLAAIGVDYVFGVDGANIEDLYDAAYFCSDLTAILVKHEFSAATMADGYSRSGAGLGVMCATSGGGCLNTVAGLGESLASRVPVLALIGQAPTSLDGQGAFQDTSGRNDALNGEALFSAVSVYCRRVVNPADIVSALPEAIAAAKSGGPAVLLLPKNVQQSKIESNNSCQLLKRLIGDPYPVAQALRRAAGPVTIIAGEQVGRDDARAELEQLRAALRARVATVPAGGGHLQHRRPHQLRVPALGGPALARDVRSGPSSGPLLRGWRRADHDRHTRLHPCGIGCGRKGGRSSPKCPAPASSR
jgi:acetolactate synthase-1/2/3 large subunit